MRNLFATLTALLWCLWLGGMITLLIFVLMLFRTDRPTALHAAPRMFVTFGQYQLILAAVALISTFIWRLTVRSKWITTMFATFALAAIGAGVLGAQIVPRMEEIRLAGQSSTSEEYKSLHGRSSTIYTCEAALLLIGAIILPLAIADSWREKAPAASAAKDSPA